MNRPMGMPFPSGSGGRGERGERGTKNRRPERERSLAELSVTVWLAPGDCRFFEKNGLLFLEKDGKEQRVILCRQFPFDLPWEFLSVLNEEQDEIGILRSLDGFDAEQKELLVKELERRYFAPVIKSIESIKERFGFSRWKVTTSNGKEEFTMQDTYRNIIRISSDRLILNDVDGNRFEIPDLAGLDAKSYRKLELYL